MHELSLTLHSYQSAADRYLAASGWAPSHLVFLERVLADLIPGASMFEIGSGPGTDADWFAGHGIDVRRSDATPAFVDRLRALGHDCDLLDVVADEIAGRYDLVFANAVLLHLSVEQFDDVLSRIARHASLLAFTLKVGDGGAWSTAKLDVPRWFTYWREPALREHLTATGWRPRWIVEADGRTERWLHVLCERII